MNHVVKKVEDRSSLAETYGVKKSTINGIVKGRKWK